MRCPRCNTENRAGARFCRKCAGKLVLVCSQCGAELPADAGFCDACGAPLTPTPPTAPPAETIADRLLRQVPKEYAERLLATRGQPHDERRTVTILFSDIKGSTAMLSKLDPEEGKEVIQGAFEFLIAPIYRYEGTLVQLMGDAILAFFGAPIAHEDDPERACRAALDITAESAEYAERLKRERGIEGFSVRVGLNTGLVVVGEVGSDLRVAYTAIGDAINLAARMEQNAEPGTVLVTEATHRLVAPLFETQAMPPLQVKGKEEPLATYRVLGAKAVAGKVRGIAGLESPLVGREAELAALREALEHLGAGVGGIVTIVGEAGLGKSRLVAEIRKEYPQIAVAQITQIGQMPRSPPSVIASPPTGGVAISGLEGGDCFAKQMARNDVGEKMARNDGEIHWVEGRCLSYGTSIAYLLWLDVLRGLLGVTAEDSPERVRDIMRERLRTLCGETAERQFAYLARLLSLPLDAATEARLRDLDGQELKANTFAAVEALLAAAAGECPLAIVLEDMHWADPTSLELLERLLALTDRASILFLCAFRPQPEHGSWRIREIAASTYGHRHTDVRLRPLSSDESGTLLGNLLGMPALSAAFRERVLLHAEGNPFYVEEILRSLIGSGAMVTAEAGGWRLTRDVDDLPIPETLQGVLLARIDRLHEDTKRVLQMAAVIGRSFLYRLLTAIAEQEKDLDRNLVLLQREQMIRERARIPELEYIFKHHLTQEAAYNGLLKAERRALHRQVAEALERLFPERLGEQVGLLAHHWEQAGDAARAVPYLLRAGDAARLAYAHAEAVDYYRRALIFQEQEADPEPAARTWMKLGLTYHTAFDYRQSQECYARGFATWQRAAQLPYTAATAAPHPLRVGLAQHPVTLDPGRCNDSASTAIISQLFRPLVQFTPELDIVPDAAQSWEISEGGLRYVFHLRTDMRWSDGQPVTAGDYAYSFQRGMRLVKGVSADDQWSCIKGVRAFLQGTLDDEAQLGIEAVDDATLVVQLEEPTGYLLQLHALGWPVPRHAVERYGEAWTEPANMVTCGPFRLKAGEPGRSLSLERDPLYQGAFTGNVQGVEFVVLPNAAEGALIAYERGELDVAEISYLTPAEAARARRQHAGEYLALPGAGLFYVGFDLTRAPFDDVRVRQALVMAVDRETMVQHVVSGNAAATGGVVPPGLPGHSPGIALPYNPQAARELLSAAGYRPGGHLAFPTVDFWRSSGRATVESTEYLTRQWRENLGIELHAQSMEWAAYLERLSRGLPHLWWMGWAPDYPDPDNFLRTAISQRGRGFPRLPYQDLIEKARCSTDQAQRMQFYRQADRMVVQEAVVMPIAYMGEYFLVKPWIKRCPLSAFAPPFLKDVVMEAH